MIASEARLRIGFIPLADAADCDEREQENRRGRPVGGHGRGAVEMIASEGRLRIGFIPLADAAALIAVDKGFIA